MKIWKCNGQTVCITDSEHTVQCMFPLFVSQSLRERVLQLIVIIMRMKDERVGECECKRRKATNILVFVRYV